MADNEISIQQIREKLIELQAIVDHIEPRTDESRSRMLDLSSDIAKAIKIKQEQLPKPSVLITGFKPENYRKTE